MTHVTCITHVTTSPACHPVTCLSPRAQEDIGVAASKEAFVAVLHYHGHLPQHLIRTLPLTLTLTHPLPIPSLSLTYP